MTRSPLPSPGEIRTVYTIHERISGTQVGAYDRSYGDQFEFPTAAQARDSNVHDMYQDRQQYEVRRWKVTYELLGNDDD